MRNAEQIIEQAGLKSTSSRLEVMTVLVQSKLPKTHQEILKQLPDNFDRVTLYRVLDWLLKNHMIHRIAGEDRAWRFQLNGPSDMKQGEKKVLPKGHHFLNGHTHAHFKCAECGKVYCLENVHPVLTDTIPADFVVDSIELSIRGKCNNCQK
jgi:Fur family ferric uptake transcriptional regulator